jgi:hypothetical protein
MHISTGAKVRGRISAMLVPKLEKLELRLMLSEIGRAQAAQEINYRNFCNVYAQPDMLLRRPKVCGWVS